MWVSLRPLDTSFMNDRELEENPDDERAWMLRNGFSRAASDEYKLVAHLNSGNAKITSIDARVVHSGPTEGGTAACEIAQGGTSNYSFGIDLDSTDKSARVLDSGHEVVPDSITNRPYFREESVNLTADETQVFSLRVTAKTRSYSWTLKVSYFENGIYRQADLTANPNGKPMELMGQGALYQTVFVEDVLDHDTWKASREKNC